MIQAMIALSIVLLTAAATSHVNGAAASISPRSVNGPGRLARAPHPRVVENGTDLVLFPYINEEPPNSLALTPNGDAYFVDGTNRLIRLAPDGTYAAEAVPNIVENHKIIYARANLWMGAADGLVKIDPDGSHYHHYTLSPTMNTGLAAGPDHGIYGDARVVHDDGTITGTIFRIDTRGAVTSVAVPVQPGDIAFGSDGRLYFTYSDILTSTWGIGRIEANGSVKLFPVATGSCCFETEIDSSLVLSNGNLYFGYYFNNISWFFGKIAPSGAITRIPLPDNIPTELVYGTMTADQGGNIWLNVGDIYFDEPQNGLYQYNVYTGHYNGPYEHPVLGQFTGYTGLQVGPDDNIWFGYSNDINLYVGAYVKHVQTLEPASVSPALGTPASFSILEAHLNGPWTAQSTNPSIATVSPTISTTGDFSVSRTGSGATTIAVKDRLGNIIYENVTAQ